jgi:hypothetical protein
MRSQDSLSTPKLCRHPDGRAYIRLRGKFHYLGRFGTAEATQRYHALLAELAGYSSLIFQRASHSKSLLRRYSDKLFWFTQALREGVSSLPCALEPLLARWTGAIPLAILQP